MTKTTIKQMMMVLVILVVSLYFVSGTYARYTGSGTGTGTVQVAKWKITVGGIGNGSTNMNIDFKQVPNKHVVDGKIAPDTELYADVVIDPSGTEVSIDYSFEIGDITSNIPGGAVPKDMHVTRVYYLNENNEVGEPLKTKIVSDGLNGNKTIYYGSILLPAKADKGETAQIAFSSEDAVKVRIYAEWENNEESNDNDSEIARTSNEAPIYSVQIKATCTQHIASDD